MLTQSFLEIRIFIEVYNWRNKQERLGISGFIWPQKRTRKEKNEWSQSKQVLFLIFHKSPNTKEKVRQMRTGSFLEIHTFIEVYNWRNKQERLSISGFTWPQKRTRKEKMNDHNHQGVIMNGWIMGNGSVVSILDFYPVRIPVKEKKDQPPLPFKNSADYNDIENTYPLFLVIHSQLLKVQYC